MVPTAFVLLLDWRSRQPANARRLAPALFNCAQWCLAAEVTMFVFAADRLLLPLIPLQSGMAGVIAPSKFL